MSDFLDQIDDEAELGHADPFRYDKPSAVDEARIKPTIPELVAHFSRAMTRWIKKGLPVVSKKEYLRRMDICVECSGGWRCPHCGCVIRAKAALETEICPEGRWEEKIEAKQIDASAIKSKTKELYNMNVFFNAKGKPVNPMGQFSNQSVFLIMNGPSFKKTNKTILDTPGVITFGVNNGPVIYRPNVWMAVDPPYRFMSHIWEDPAIMKFTFTGHAKKKYGRQNKKKVGDCPNLFMIKQNSDFNPQAWLYEPTFNWGDSKKRHGRVCVMLPSIKICYLLGFRKIYLVGCDFFMDEENKYSFEEDRTKAAITSNMRLYTLLTTYLNRLQPYFKAAGLEIYNCNPESKLAVFPYKDIIEAISEVKLDTSVSSFGMYKKKVS